MTGYQFEVSQRDQDSSHFNWRQRYDQLFMVGKKPHIHNKRPENGQIHDDDVVSTEVVATLIQRLYEIVTRSYPGAVDRDCSCKIPV